MTSQAPVQPLVGVNLHYRRHWSQGRGDAYDDWGSCDYYFWVLDGVVEMQVQAYANGVVLAYDRDHVQDQYGFLITDDLDPHSWGEFRIAQDDFVAAVHGSSPLNRRS